MQKKDGSLNVRHFIKIFIKILFITLIIASVSGCTAPGFKNPIKISISTTPTALPTKTAIPKLTASQLMMLAAPSIVRVVSPGIQGTGFVYREGQVLTAFHVIGDIKTVITIISSEGIEYRAMVIGADEERDLALLSVPGLPLASLPLAESVEVGDQVYAIGYAGGLAGEASITQGIISAKRIEPVTSFTLLQTDTALNPGNSGGPLLNEYGKVVGINVLRLKGEFAEYENMGFAVSVEEIKRVSESLLAGNIHLMPTLTPTTRPTSTRRPTARPQPTATSRPTPTAIPAPVKEWCIFRSKVYELNNAGNEWFANYLTQSAGKLISVDEWQMYANQYSAIRDLACSLPRVPVEANTLADKYCAGYDAYLNYLRENGNFDYIVAFIANSGQAQELFNNLDAYFGHPSCNW